MRILVAPDSFKESLNAAQVAECIEKGLRSVLPSAQYDLIPMADGGEGSLHALISAVGGKLRKCRASDPLGRPIECHYGVMPDGETAIVEVAQASGLTLLTTSERNPLLASSYGTGECIRAALEAGLRKFIVCLGGSAVNDCGMGMLQALGFQFFDAEENLLAGNGANLALVRDIKPPPGGIDAHFTILTDVENVLVGDMGATRVFGPQKGATPALIEKLEAGMLSYSQLVEELFGRKIHEYEGGGAAGGLGAAFLGFLTSERRAGAEFISEAVSLESRVSQADYVFTGEGCLDAQTPFGKTVRRLCVLAKRHDKPLIALSGAMKPGFESLYLEGLTSAFSALTLPVDLETALAQAGPALENLAQRVGRLLLCERSQGTSSRDCLV